MGQSSLGVPQTVLVVGGTSDIGCAIANRLVQEGTERIILAGRDLSGLRQRAALFPCEAAVVEFEARDFDRHSAFSEQLDKHADIDLAVIAIGQLSPQGEAFDDPAVAAHMAQVNYVGAMSVMLHLATRLKRQGHGTLLVLSSIAAVRARPSNFIYGSTKAALDSFAQGLAFDLEGSGSRLVIARPGFVRSKMTAGMDGPFPVSPEDVAEAVVRQLPTRRVIWVPRVLWPIAVALQVIPRTILRRLPA